MDLTVQLGKAFSAFYRSSYLDETVSAVCSIL